MLSIEFILRQLAANANFNLDANLIHLICSFLVIDLDSSTRFDEKHVIDLYIPISINPLKKIHIHYGKIVDVKDWGIGINIDACTDRSWLSKSEYLFLPWSSKSQYLFLPWSSYFIENKILKPIMKDNFEYHPHLKRVNHFALAVSTKC